MVDEAASRVQAYLDALAKLRGLSQETIHTIGVRGGMYSLTRADLETLLDAVWQEEP